jgi:hypothetical protein
MKDKVNLSAGFRVLAGTLIIIGLLAFIYGFIHDSGRTWANYLLNNYYFLLLALGAAFFLALQYVVRAGWSAGFMRVAEAMMLYVPVAAIFFLLIYFGMDRLYEWTQDEAVAEDALIAHKSPYLNIPFFFIRMVLFFGLWILMILLLRKTSQKADGGDSLARYHRAEHYSKILIFILAVTMTLGTIDWIKSIDVHWFSTIFALKNFVAAFYHGSAVIALVVFFLHGRGYFPFLNKYHIHDFARYIFILAIIWGYFWFAQFMLIWYGNLPEETVYFVKRWEEGWKSLFFLDIIVNWFVPFMVLLPLRTSRSMTVITLVALLLIPGQYLDLYLQVMPGTVGEPVFGLIEAGTFLGYAGLFILAVAYALSRAPLVPSSHPYLSESMEHQF